MRRSVTVKLRRHKASGRLFKTIGYALGRDGKPKKRVWYFDPSDEAAALQRAVELTARWRTLRQSGKRMWDECPDFIASRFAIGVRRRQGTCFGRVGEETEARPAGAASSRNKNEAINSNCFKAEQLLNISRQHPKSTASGIARGRAASAVK